MNVARKLDQVMPGVPGEASEATANELIALLPRLSRADYQELIMLLPDRLAAIPPGPIMPNARQAYIDRVGYETLYFYRAHVGARLVSKAIRRLSTARRAQEALRLSLLLSPPVLARLLDGLLAVEVRDFLADLVEALEGYRPGSADLAIETIAAGLEKKAGFWGRSGATGHDLEVVRAAQVRRRKDRERLPSKPMHTNEVRFLVEEIKRELFVYRPADEKKAGELIDTVYAWYRRSKLLVRTSGRPIYMVEAGFFTELHSIRVRLQLGATYKPHWDYYIASRLSSERFWENIAGLNGDIRPELTEAGHREQLYRRAALTGALLYGALITAPVLAVLAVRAPGGAVRAFRWVGGRLLVSAQYAHATYRAYGLAGGVVAAGRDAYGFLLQRPIETTQTITSGVEMVLDLTGAETGLAPGSSPADAVDAIGDITRKVARKGIAAVAESTPTVGTQVEAVEFVASSQGELKRVTAAVVSYEAGQLRVRPTDVKPAAGPDRTVLFLTPEKTPSASAGARAVDNSATAAAGKATEPSKQQLLLTEGKISEAARATAKQLGVEAHQVQRIADVLAKPFTEMPGFKKTWDRFRRRRAGRIQAILDMFADPKLTRKEIADKTRPLFGEIRTDFWKHVADAEDEAARQVRQQLVDAGFALTGGPPRLSIGGVTLTLDIDHKKELGMYAADALSPKNLRLAPSRENRVVLNKLMSRDPFQPQYRGRARNRGLLVPSGDDKAHEEAAKAAREGIKEALERLDDPAFEW